MDIEKMYQDKEGEFTWESDSELDNNEAMQEFLWMFKLTGYIVEDEGTLVYLFKENERQLIVLESYGRGDTFSHAVSYNLSCLSTFENDKEAISKICEINGGPITEVCNDCAGSAMGRYDGTRCSSCKGRGVHVIFGK